MSDDQAALESAASTTAEQQWPVTIALTHPVAFGSETIESLEFRRGRMGDLKGVSIDGVPSVDQLVLIASRMCGKPVKVIEMLDVDDSGKVLTLALGFFARSLGAGSGRSQP